MEAYQEYLEQKYGPIMVKSVGSDQRSMDALGMGTAGMDNIVIAPNILEKMANDPQKAAHYEKIIDDFFDSQPRVKAQMSAMGFDVQSYGVVIHPDGTAHYYLSGDLKPEVRAKIEAKIKAEDEAKAERKRRYRELSEEAAEKRRQEMELIGRRQNIAALLAKRTGEAGRITCVGTTDDVISSFAAYIAGF